MLKKWGHSDRIEAETDFDHIFRNQRLLSSTINIKLNPKYVLLFILQSPALSSESSIFVDKPETPVESPLPSPCKLIQQCNAAVTMAGDDIERAADQDDDTDSDNEKKKPVFQ